MLFEELSKLYKNLGKGCDDQPAAGEAQGSAFPSQHPIVHVLLHEAPSSALTSLIAAYVFG